MTHVLIVQSTLRQSGSETVTQFTMFCCPYLESVTVLPFARWQGLISVYDSATWTELEVDRAVLLIIDQLSQIAYPACGTPFSIKAEPSVWETRSEL